MDPNNYLTRGPEKPRKDEPRRARPRPGTSGRRSSPLSSPSGEPPKWLRFFKEVEHAKSLQYIGAMFKKNRELTYDALAIHLHNKVSPFKSTSRIAALGASFSSFHFIQMSNHTVNSWKKYCTHRTDAIEDLRRRAISNAKKKATPKDKDMADATREMLPIILREATPHQDSHRLPPRGQSPASGSSTHRSPTNSPPSNHSLSSRLPTNNHATSHPPTDHLPTKCPSANHPSTAYPPSGYSSTNSP